MCIRHATSTKSPLPVAMIEAPLLARLVSRSRCPSREPPRHARARPRAVLEASVTRPTEEEPTRAPQAPPSNDDVHEDRPRRTGRAHHLVRHDERGVRRVNGARQPDGSGLTTRAVAFFRVPEPYASAPTERQKPTVTPRIARSRSRASPRSLPLTRQERRCVRNAPARSLHFRADLDSPLDYDSPDERLLATR